MQSTLFKRLALLCLFTAAVACNKINYKAEVESDTSWSGSFGNRSVDGSGNQIVELPNDDVVCIVVQKNTAGGYLRARIIDDSHGFLNPAYDSKWVETTAEFGVVDVCNQ